MGGLMRRGRRRLCSEDIWNDVLEDGLIDVCMNLLMKGVERWSVVYLNVGSGCKYEYDTFLK
jgi:hypothetical protein